MKTIKSKYYCPYVLPLNSGVMDTVTNADADIVTSGWIVTQPTDLLGEELVNWVYEYIIEHYKIAPNNLLILAFNKVDSWSEEID